jgi:predicted nucleic acid-binding protein
MSLVVDASVGLKWVLPEPDSHLAEALVLHEPDLLVPDFWLHEATNILWLQVRKTRFTPDEAREALALLRAQLAPTPTADMALHEVALEIGIEVNHSTYDTLYLAFAVAMGASAVVLADGPFVRAMRSHPDASLAALPLPLEAWARSRDIAA